VRCARGVSSPSDATHIEAGGVAETSGGAATIAGT
jgi:hypothetical protein